MCIVRGYAQHVAYPKCSTTGFVIGSARSGFKKRHENAIQRGPAGCITAKVELSSRLANSYTAAFVPASCPVWPSFDRFRGVLGDKNPAARADAILALLSDSASTWTLGPDTLGKTRHGPAFKREGYLRFGTGRGQLACGGNRGRLESVDILGPHGFRAVGFEPLVMVERRQCAPDSCPVRVQARWVWSWLTVQLEFSEAIL